MSDNDFTLDRLFRPTKPVTIADRKLVVRALSGPEQELRSLYANNQARKVEKELADTTSDVYQMRIEALKDLSVEELATLSKNMKSVDIQREVVDKNQPVYQPYPDEATDEEKRAVDQSREDAEKARQEKIKADAKTALDEYAATLAGKTLEELLAIVRPQMVKSIIQERQNMSFAYYSVFAQVQDESGKRYFQSAEEASNMHRDVMFNLFGEAQAVNNVNPLGLASNGLSSTA